MKRKTVPNNDDRTQPRWISIEEEKKMTVFCCLALCYCLVKCQYWADEARVVTNIIISCFFLLVRLHYEQLVLNGIVWIGILEARFNCNFTLPLSPPRGLSNPIALYCDLSSVTLLHTRCRLSVGRSLDRSLGLRVYKHTLQIHVRFFLMDIL